MTTVGAHRALRYAALLAAAAVTASCVKDRIVYRETAAYTEPPAAAANFVGYAREQDKQTVCGNCHIDIQTKWVETKHASAWESLQASGHAGPTCEACHTVSQLGNAATDANVGFAATKDARYHDVQCESCHGAGLTHIKGPTSANRPLATIKADTGAALSTGCGECHTGTHEPYVDEWRASGHGIGAELAGHANGASCLPCHSAQGALAAWGVTSNYLEKTAAPMTITCAVCHDPHSPSNTGQLRFAIDDPTETGNLCMKCHHKRGTPDLTSQSRGAHSPEGPTLLGYAGWFPPSFDLPDTIVATHGSDRNPRLCAGCHVTRTSVTNPATGAFVFQGTGHGFNAIPCLDSIGRPTQGDCAMSARSFKACTGSGCHGSEAVARSAMATAEMRIEDLAQTLQNLIIQIPSTEFAQNSAYTTGEGAKFNLSLAANVDPATNLVTARPGQFIHNPFLLEALLTASIRQVKLDYGLTTPASVNLNNVLRH